MGHTVAALPKKVFCVQIHFSPRLTVYEHAHLLRERTDRVVKNSWHCFDKPPLPSGKYGVGWGGVCEERYLITLLFSSVSLSIYFFAQNMHTPKSSGYPKKATAQPNGLQTTKSWVDEAITTVTANLSITAQQFITELRQVAVSDRWLEACETHKLQLLS